MKSLFKTVSLFGFGMMAGSLAHAIKKHGVAEHLIGFDRRPESLEKGIELGLIDMAADTATKATAPADLVILCVPVSQCKALAAKIAPHLKDSAIITDIGSTKASVIEGITAHISPMKFVPGHPIAGSEKSGPQHFVEDLFKNRYCVLTPLAETNPEATDRVSQLWQKLGARVETMEPQQHDLVMALISHLPQMLSSSMADTVRQFEADQKIDAIRFAASGYATLSRLAGSTPSMWRDIFLNNSDHMKQVLQTFRERLQALEVLIDAQDADGLYRALSDTRDWHLNWYLEKEKEIKARGKKASGQKDGEAA